MSEAPATKDRPHPRVVVRKDVVTRELDLETGEEVIRMDEGTNLVVTERGPRHLAPTERATPEPPKAPDPNADST